MKLKEWLAKENKRVVDMANDLGIVHCMVRVWANGTTIPNREYMEKIREYTHGEVMPNDFYDFEGKKR